VWQRLAQQYSSIPPPPDTCPQARFSHLTIYGACYYSYLYARCISEALWNVHLAADPLDPSAGVWDRAELVGMQSVGRYWLPEVQAHALRSLAPSGCL
jgi:Zn-dependent oligopeptidase